MASVEPQERAKELQFLLRMLTEGAPLDTSSGPEARGFDWGPEQEQDIAFQRRGLPIPPRLSNADAINIAISILGAKGGGPKGKGAGKGREEPAVAVGPLTESAVIRTILESKAAKAKMSDAELAAQVQALVAKGHGTRSTTAPIYDPVTKQTYEHPYGEGMAQSVMDDLHWNFEKPQTYAAPAPGPSSWPMAGTPTRGPVLPPQDYPRPQPVAPGPGTPATATPAEILKQIKEKGGYTVNLETGDVPSSGIMAGKFANKDPRTRVIEGDPTMVDITSWAKQNEKALKGPKADYAGFWHDKESGKTYFDVAKRFNPEGVRPATKFAERTGQISLYDIGKDAFPPVGNFRENLTSPEVRERWREAGKWGEDYMTAQNLPEWWDTPYFRHVYGEKIARENVPGFVGAVSTNTRPRPNVQGASEYLRRHIKGEDIIQPDFRVEESAMGGFSGPGKRMGLEAGRAANLLRAAAGETRGSAYSGPVVQEKVNVFAGDPNEAVIDRLQMRPVENPSRGIYAHSQEATTPEPGKRSSAALPERPPDRDLMKEEMLDEATKQGKTLRNFSAQIWAGLRERVKSHGEVWGVKGTASPDESFSYNDHLIQLVKDKAKHLGISVKEMETRLRNGDANLLSYLLAASPVLAEAYKGFSSGSQSEVVPPPGDVAP